MEKLNSCWPRLLVANGDERSLQRDAATCMTELWLVHFPTTPHMEFLAHIRRLSMILKHWHPSLVHFSNTKHVESALPCIESAWPS
jgi:hypothetical protein